jgi:hypothetical protein
VIAGAEGWEDIEDYGESKLELLRELLPFADGIPSDDTLRRFFRGIGADAFREVFVAFVRDLLPQASDRLIAVDGKTSRRSHDGQVKALHLVSQGGRSPPRASADGDGGEKQRNYRDSRTAATARPARRNDFHRRHGLPA